VTQLTQMRGLLLGSGDCARVTGQPESAGINRHVGVSKEGWRIQ
jgi:hypothetical protein